MIEPKLATPAPPQTVDDGTGSYKRFIRTMPISGHFRYGESMEYTRFEKARIIGARSLQISLGAPILIDTPEDMIDPIKIAMLEYDNGAIPITVNREERGC